MSLNYLSPQAYIDAVATLLDLDDIPEYALSGLLENLTPEEYGGYCID